ncbi:MAG: DUF1444 family protein [Phycisphaeraceae bacterium]|nr:DUF1444 family protein [Phycisphaeraceae bacterium]MCW5755490.1 DUF1444 family protein [Phycisphaeraceae bacterium]
MSLLPPEPGDFAVFVAEMLRRIQPHASVELVGPAQLAVNGRRLDLENLQRMVNQDPERGVEIAEHYLEQLFANDVAHMTDVPFELARPRIMPRIQPKSVFDHLNKEMVAHVPFVNNTVIVFVTDFPQMTVSITTEQVIKWGLTCDEIEQIARANLDRYAPRLEMRMVESKEGGRAAILAEQDGYDAARLLMTGLFSRLAPQLGGDFYVATPSRDMFVAMSAGPDPFLGRIRERVEQDYHRLPYPITSDFFYVTRDGVAGTIENEAA